MSQFTIVLAYPRTGSSMCMQTLKYLGVHVIGDSERPDLDVEGNPKGYYEDIRVLGAGLTEAIIAEYRAIDAPQIAFKLAYKPLLNRKKGKSPEAQIEHLESLRPRIILTVRNPLESIISSERWVKQDNLKKQFIRVTLRLKKYRQEVDQVIDILKQQSWLTPESCLVEDYHAALNDPAGYVHRLSEFTQCNPSAEQIEAAIANISPELFRYKLSELPQEVIEWDKKLGASATYERLLKPIVSQ